MSLFVDEHTQTEEERNAQNKWHQIRRHGLCSVFTKHFVCVLCNNLVSKLAAINEENEFWMELSTEQAVNVGQFADTGCNLNGLPLQRMAFNLKTTIDKITKEKATATKIQ